MIYQKMNIAAFKFSDIIFRPSVNFFSGKPPKGGLNEEPVKRIKKDLVPKSLDEVEERDVTIQVPEELDIQLLRPEFDDLRERIARISKRSKNCMQSGKFNLNQWRLMFDTKKRWENPCIGYCSSGDPISSLVLQFSNKKEGINFCKKNNWKYFTSETPTKTKPKIRGYGDNFSYNKRTRVGTK
uniref:NADH dehydrogenase [ubiquinone] iron-sulfur protein 4, mitochondrial n=1 Tax=Diabrotica virgifera virgifera TaxID=50390 RepID=A0A6P7F1C2_DIAVI